MKDKLKIFIFIFFLLVLFFYQNILVYNKLIFKTILLSFVPSLLPCLIIINLLLELDVLTYVYNFYLYDFRNAFHANIIK